MLYTITHKYIYFNYNQYSILIIEVVIKKKETSDQNFSYKLALTQLGDKQETFAP